MATRRALLLALALAFLAPGTAHAERTVRLDAVRHGVDNRALVVGFVRAHVGAVIGLTALVPMHVVAGADPDRELRYGLDDQRGRTLLRISGGFALQSAVRRNQWHLERTYLVDGFFRVTDRGEGAAAEGRVIELSRVDRPAGPVETITDFAD